MTKRYFLGAQEVAGMMTRLNNAFHSMGIKSDFYCLYEYKFEEYNQDQAPRLLRIYRKHTNKIRKAKSIAAKKFWYFIQMLDILRILVHSLIHYDNFIYIFGHGMFLYNYYLKNIEEFEFFVLKLFHKKMIMWNCGSDTRAPYCGVDLYNGDKERMYRDIARKKNKVQMIEKYMICMDNPASSHFHTKPYISTFAIGIPIEKKECVQKESSGERSENYVTILHAPSNEKVKGTDIIRSIINEIKEERNLKYVEVSGQTHMEVLRKMKEADIIVDQLYTDTPMAGLATEASINGIPVICAGYYAECYKKILKTPLHPTVYCLPEELKTKLLSLIDDRDKREKIGEAERNYVKERLMSPDVAERFIRVFEDDISLDWICIPEENEYIYGMGCPKEKVIENVVWLVEHYGEEALGIPVHSKLMARYRELYNQYTSEIGDGS